MDQVERKPALKVSSLLHGGVTALVLAACGGGGGSTAPSAPVASVTVSPATATVSAGATVQLAATTKDAARNVLTGRVVTWTTGNAAVATVSSTGLVSGVAVGGPVTITATSEAQSGTAAVTVTGPSAISFVTVSAGNRHTCSLTVTGSAYCWGLNNTGELGADTAIDSLTAPVAVTGGISFAAVSAGSNLTCGVTTNKAAYCWGANFSGQLGIGTAAGPQQCSVYGPCSLKPMAVAGGLTFAGVTAGTRHTCGITSANVAYCWGDNGFGELGIGMTTGSSTTPVAVAGQLTFGEVSAAFSHTCGVTTMGTAYCWGDSRYGELGINTTTGPQQCSFSGTLFPCSPTPTTVAGTLRFAAVSAGGGHSCGVTTTGEVYCWGLNDFGELGTGTTRSDSAPAAIAGGLTFAAISAGNLHTCGVTTTGAAYCWGDNKFGELGIGSTTGPQQCSVSGSSSPCSLTPMAVAGGLTYAAVSAGVIHTCGITTTRVVYCWGDNALGELGTGTTTTSSVPVKVAGQ